MSDPKEIFLQPFCEYCDDRRWCEHDMQGDWCHNEEPECEKKPSVRYVRADLHDELKAENKRLRGASAVPDDTKHPHAEFLCGIANGDQLYDWECTMVDDGTFDYMPLHCIQSIMTQPHKWIVRRKAQEDSND